jgi:transcriptional regulator with XRE-family HTH domain
MTDSFGCMSFPTTATNASPSATTTAILGDLGSRLRHCRENAALTREEVATLLGRSAGAVRDWELGQRRPNAVQVAKMARAYAVPITELTGEVSR